MIQKKHIFNQFSQLITVISSRSNRNLGKGVNKTKNCSHALEDVSFSIQKWGPGESCWMWLDKQTLSNFPWKGMNVVSSNSLPNEHQLDFQWIIRFFCELSLWFGKGNKIGNSFPLLQCVLRQTGGGAYSWSGFGVVYGRYPGWKMGPFYHVSELQRALRY